MYIVVRKTTTISNLPWFLPTTHAPEHYRILRLGTALRPILEVIDNNTSSVINRFEMMKLMKQYSKAYRL